MPSIEGGRLPRHYRFALIRRMEVGRAIRDRPYEADGIRRCLSYEKFDTSKKEDYI